MTPSGKPLWISHRGDTRAHTENTHAAFEAACARGFPVLETDLRITRDDHIVLAHDPTLARLCGDRRPLASLTREELARVQLPDGSSLLFLDVFVRDFPHVRWTFDVKPEHGDRTLHALALWAGRRGQGDRIQQNTRFLVWRRAHARLLRALFPHAEIYAGQRACTRAGIAVLLRVPAMGGIRAGTTYSLPPRARGIPLYREHVLRPYRRRGARLLAFLPEREEDVRAALRLGFDEILTNGEIVEPR